MKDLIKKPMDFRKKISLNINVEILKLVKNLAKLTKTNDTLVIESLLVKGISPLIKQFRDSWTAMFYDTKDNLKKEHLTKLLNELKEISEKEEYLPLINQ
jgi:hypothetical protein